MPIKALNTVIFVQKKQNFWNEERITKKNNDIYAMRTIGAHDEGVLYCNAHFNAHGILKS